MAPWVREGRPRARWELQEWRSSGIDDERRDSSGEPSAAMCWPMSSRWHRCEYRAQRHVYLLPALAGSPTRTIQASASRIWRRQRAAMLAPLGRRPGRAQLPSCHEGSPFCAETYRMDYLRPGHRDHSAPELGPIGRWWFLTMDSSEDIAGHVASLHDDRGDIRAPGRSCQ